MDVNLLVLALFLVGGGLVALMVVVTQRSYKKDERGEHWMVYPSAKGGHYPIPTQPGPWSLVLDGVGTRKIHVIKELRKITNLGLVEAKEMSERIPATVLTGVDHGSASAAYRMLANVGATVRLSEGGAAAEPIGPAGTYTVVLDDAGSRKIHVIKEIRALTGLGLAEAKGLTDRTPATILSGVDHATAGAAQAQLVAAGAAVRVNVIGGHPTEPAPTAPAAPEAEPETGSDVSTGSYTVVLDYVGMKRIEVVKEVRAITGLGLAESKALVDGAPSTILSGVRHEAASAAQARLAALGAVVHLDEV
ncbi:ribosomal protein L7/L12 [Glycomyces sp. NRRL B-16210]|uniref:ribosomal protein L7/L12 n=1 Tax=Glycomyces sp. NRRL B-16210 TaxID=1463821 RepID=UPI00068AD49A|nr:ribosomal protein L7/L12 [Glycomyces sp. NRRL B-16210]